MKQNWSDLFNSVADSQVFPSSKVRDLGVVFDQYLTFQDLTFHSLSATLAQWGERSLSERTAQVLFPVRPDKTYTVFC